MTGAAVWGAWCVVVAVLCVRRPDAGRLVVGVLFLVMGLVVNGALVLTDPEAYEDLVESAWFAPYHALGGALVDVSPVLLGLAMMVLEVAIGLLVLGRGRRVRLGLVAGCVFLLATVPLGVEEVPNLVLAAGMAALLTWDFPERAVVTLRRRYGWSARQHQHVRG